MLAWIRAICHICQLLNTPNCKREKKIPFKIKQCFQCAKLSFVKIQEQIKKFKKLKLKKVYCKRYLLAGSFSIFLSCVLWSLFWLDLCTLFCFVALPDLIIDTKELKRVMRLDSERLQRLRCAHEENCLAKSADVLFSPRYVYRLFYSSFNTHPKVA